MSKNKKGKRREAGAIEEEVNQLIETLVNAGESRNFFEENWQSDKNNFVSEVGFPEGITFDPEEDLTPVTMAELGQYYQFSNDRFIGIVSDSDEITCMLGLLQISQMIEAEGQLGGCCY